MARVARKAYPESSENQEALIAETFANLEMTTEPQQAVSKADLVVEAIVENMSIKRKLFEKLDTLASPDTIFASNTSSLSITEISASTSQARQSKFAGLHYFNPVRL